MQSENSNQPRLVLNETFNAPFAPDSRRSSFRSVVTKSPTLRKLMVWSAETCLSPLAKSPQVNRNPKFISPYSGVNPTVAESPTTPLARNRSSSQSNGTTLIPTLESILGDRKVSDISSVKSTFKMTPIRTPSVKLEVFKPTFLKKKLTANLIIESVCNCNFTSFYSRS